MVGSTKYFSSRKLRMRITKNVLKVYFRRFTTCNKISDRNLFLVLCYNTENIRKIKRTRTKYIKIKTYIFLLLYAYDMFKTNKKKQKKTWLAFICFNKSKKYYACTADKNIIRYNINHLVLPSLLIIVCDIYYN